MDSMLSMMKASTVANKLPMAELSWCRHIDNETMGRVEVKMTLNTGVPVCICRYRAAELKDGIGNACSELKRMSLRARD